MKCQQPQAIPLGRKQHFKTGPHGLISAAKVLYWGWVLPFTIYCSCHLLPFERTQASVAKIIRRKVSVDFNMKSKKSLGWRLEQRVCSDPALTLFLISLLMHRQTGCSISMLSAGAASFKHWPRIRAQETGDDGPEREKRQHSLSLRASISKRRMNTDSVKQ